MKPSIDKRAYIGDEVVFGEDCEVRPFATVVGQTTFGKRNRVFQYASIGDEPQDHRYQGEPTQVLIGDDNLFREGISIHRGTVKGGGLTRIGNHNFFMSYSHIAHDCIVGDHNIFTSFCGLSGHVEVGDHVIVGGHCGAHQFTRIGSYAFLSHACLIPMDAPPFMMVVGGHDPYVVGLNTRGLQRHGFSKEDLSALKSLYKIYYRSALTQAQALDRIEQDILPLCSKAQLFLDFVKTSQRGVMR